MIFRLVKPFSNFIYNKTMSECELCDKVIIREMSILDWDAYCDVVEKVFNDIPRVCDTLVLTVRYSCIIMKSVGVF